MHYGAGNAGTQTEQILNSDLLDGDPEEGYRYLISGNAINTGIPVAVYKSLRNIGNSTLGRLAGLNKNAVNDFVVFEKNGVKVATPGCLQCHAQNFNNEIVIGLGNSYSLFQLDPSPSLNMIKKTIRIVYGKNSPEWQSASDVFLIADILKNAIRTEMQGVTPAQKIAEVMASHHDPITLRFRPDTAYFAVPPIVIPEDVPALWTTKKRKTFTVNGMRQGNFVKHITSNSILTLNDTIEARQIYNNARNVWAYIQTLQPPKYPYPVNTTLLGNGKQIFLQNCSRCHGTYEEPEYYPNKIISPEVIRTDSLMWKYFFDYPEYAEWFNKSWFATSEEPAYAKPQLGYVAPPLDGVWITAPYLHNGSVPTLESLLNSRSRPRYWKRNLNKQQYDYEKIGWRYEVLKKPGSKKTYNTDIPGYGNYGHTFGDHLSNDERKSLIEYLKTL